MSKLLVAVKDLVKDYTSGTETLHILRGISFEVLQGSTVAVSGQSGSGKSTLLNILGGLDRCDGGAVEVAGADITGLSESSLSGYRRDRVGFIFQFHYLLKDFTALENVMLPAYMAGMKKRRLWEKPGSSLRRYTWTPGSTISPRPFPAGNGSGLPWPGLW